MLVALLVLRPYSDETENAYRSSDAHSVAFLLNNALQSVKTNDCDTHGALKGGKSSIFCGVDDADGCGTESVGGDLSCNADVFIG